MHEMLMMLNDYLLFFSWLKKFRRISQRYDKKVKHYKNFVLLACILITIKKLN